MRVRRFDQVYLVLAAIGFDGFLSRDGGGDQIVLFKPSKVLAAIVFGPTFEHALFVLPDTLNEVGGDARINRALTAIDEHVDRNDFVFVGDGLLLLPVLRHAR